MKKSSHDVNVHRTEVRGRGDNPLLNIGFNIVLPVFILKQGHRLNIENGPLIALLVALAIPLVYGLHDWIKRREKNYVAVLGFLNVGFTGLFVILHLEGTWFAFKEAFFPLLLGLGVWFSGVFGNPFIQKIFWQPGFLNLALIEQRLEGSRAQEELKKLLLRVNGWFAYSFFLSSALNFLLASKVFVPISGTLSQTEKDLLLNDQVAEMTWRGYVVIALPLTIIMFAVLWYFLRELKKLTGLSTDELVTAGMEQTRTP